jgi:hypothetical protein
MLLSWMAGAFFAPGSALNMAGPPQNLSEAPARRAARAAARETAIPWSSGLRRVGSA